MKALVLLMILFTAPSVLAKQVPLDTTASTIEWLGRKVIPGGDHKGTVKLKKGSINLDEHNQLVGGTLVIDMNSIEDTDLSGKYKTKLENHLNSEDFFHVAKHPVANFKITKVELTRSDLVKITGNLTIRGTTNQESFNVKVERNGKSMTATGLLEIDRNKYGITYNSESSSLKNAIKLAKDKIIKDDIQLTIHLQSKTL